MEHYEFIEANRQFGIEWFNNDGEYFSTVWYDTEEERLEAVDVWYANQDEHNLDQ
jgi:hypothetical protein